MTTQKTTQEYIVLETERMGERVYCITKRDNFKKIPFCETYDNYGQRNCTIECGCDEDEYGDEAEHYEVNAWVYSNGSNMRSISLEEGCDFEEVDEEISQKILSEMPDTPYIEGATEAIDTENHTFVYSRYADNPWICEVSI